MRLILILSLILPVFAAVSAQNCGFSQGKNLAELREAVYENKQPLFRFRTPDLLKSDPATLQAQNRQAVFLPHWSAESLPFFCRIEHDWGKKSRIPFKFRLGSVEYVDWLEGK